MLRKPTTARPHHGVPHPPASALYPEIALDRCYVRVGGYGWVEIVARPQAVAAARPVALALPAPAGQLAAECLLQPSDRLIIRNGRGDIAEIAVQTILDHGSFAGFCVLDPTGWALAVAGETSLQAFEHYLAGVSARTLNAKEQRERQAGAWH